MMFPFPFREATPEEKTQQMREHQAAHERYRQVLPMLADMRAIARKIVAHGLDNDRMREVRGHLATVEEDLTTALVRPVDP